MKQQTLWKCHIFVIFKTFGYDGTSRNENKVCPPIFLCDVALAVWLKFQVVLASAKVFKLTVAAI